MKVFVDTSGIYAALVATDTAHSAARDALQKLTQKNASLVTTSYVLIECHALLQARVGLDAVRTLHEVWVNEMDVVWVDEDLHLRAVRRLLKAGRRKLSLVDCVSFECMGDRGIANAFAIDEHFQEAGFRRLIVA
jgi:uncharacterized protein